MRTSATRKCAHFLLLICLIPCIARSQQSSVAEPPAGSVGQAPALKQRPLESPAPRDEAGRTLQQLQLDLVVTDALGVPAAGLTPQDFLLFENGHAIPITSLRAAGSASTPATDPVQAILLIDNVSNSFESIASERSGIELFLARDGGHLPLPISIVLFSDSGAQVGQPSRDGKLLISELKKTSTAVATINSAMGSAGAVDRFQRSLQTLNRLAAFEATRPGRKLLLWIGPGWPMLSGARFSSSERDRHADWNSIVDFSTHLRQARITLYSVESLSSNTNLAHSTYYQSFLKPVTEPDRANSTNLSLPVLAIQSGGRVVNGSNDLAAQIASCLRDATAYYALTFETTHSSRPDEYRALEVRLAKPGLTARTVSGYYAQPGRF